MARCSPQLCHDQADLKWEIFVDLTDTTCFTRSWLITFLSESSRVTDFFPLSEAMGRRTGVILRHDVDYSLKMALELAEAEHEVGVAATYFVLVSSDQYNVASKASRHLLRRLVGLGFEVGLHFDSSVYGSHVGTRETQHAALTEARILEDAVGHEVRSVSLHNPSVNAQGLFQIEGLLNAYDPQFFGPGRYLSDSRMTFRGDPTEFIESSQSSLCQLLLHPLHFTDAPRSYAELGAQMAIDWTDLLHRAMSVNETYANAGQRVVDRLHASLQEARYLDSEE